MLAYGDLGGLPPQQTGLVSIFQGGDANTSSAIKGCHAWHKPRGITWVEIYAIGAAGGGGGGVTGTSGTTRGAGAGGGSAAMVKLRTAAVFCPEVLYVGVGLGGLGGATSGIGVAGGNGSQTVIYVNSPDILNYGAPLSITGGGGGGGGASPSQGAAGVTGSTLWCTTSAGSGSGFWFAHVTSGVVGGIGSNSTATAGQQAIFSGGGSGGGSTTGSQNNGGISGLQGQAYPPWTNTAQGLVIGPVDGGHGIFNWAPLFGFGGGGGASNNLGQGGNGGNGAIGSGGGGGGAGATGGAGGRGGDGLVVIVCG